jgi:hypothetical protein
MQTHAQTQQHHAVNSGNVARRLLQLKLYRECTAVPNQGTFRKITGQNLAIIRRHVAVRRAQKPGPAPEYEAFGQRLRQVVRHCFPELNNWLHALPDPRRQDLCTYPADHIWWQIVLTCLLRNGSRNAFDADRNTGQLPANVAQLCDHVWDENRRCVARSATQNW